MSLSRSYSIECDDCSAMTPNLKSGKEARDFAKRHGWKHVAGKRTRRWARRNGAKDLCASCAKPAPTSPGGVE